MIAAENGAGTLKGKEIFFFVWGGINFIETIS